MPLLSSERYNMTAFPASLEALLAFPLGVSHVTIDDVPDISGSDPKVSTALLIQEISDSYKSITSDLNLFLSATAPCIIT